MPSEKIQNQLPIADHHHFSLAKSRDEFSAPYMEQLKNKEAL
jgi:hypothetical protein